MSGVHLALGLTGALAAAAALGSRGNRGSRASLASRVYDSTGPIRWLFHISYRRPDWAGSEHGFIDTDGQKHRTDHLVGPDLTRYLEGGSFLHEVEMESPAEMAERLGIEDCPADVQISRAFCALGGFQDAIGDWLGGGTLEYHDSTISQVGDDAFHYAARTSLDLLSLTPVPFKTVALGGRTVLQPWPPWVLEWLRQDNELNERYKLVRVDLMAHRGGQEAAIVHEKSMRRELQARRDTITASQLGVSLARLRDLQA